MKGVVHTNYPIQVYSQSIGSSGSGSSDCQRVETKLRDGNPETGTLRQSERQGKSAGRRKTNVRRHREGEPPEITVRGGNGLVERPFNPRRPQDILKKLDVCRDIAHGVKDDDMLEKSKEATGENRQADGSIRLNCDVRRNAESLGERRAEVGDARCSDDDMKNKKMSTQRGVSLSGETKEYGSSAMECRKGSIPIRKVGRKILNKVSQCADPSQI